MTAHLLRRLAASLLLVYLVVTLTFFLVHAAPGDPAATLVSGGRHQAEREARVRHALGLDRPLVTQYVAWLADAARFDWGTSLIQGRPVSRIVLEAAPHTLVLALAALLVEYGLAVPLGVWAARRRGRPADHAIRAGSLLFYSVPPFWLGLMAILVFAYLWPVLPASHMHAPGAGHLTAGAWILDLARHLVLPAAVLGLSVAGGTLRFVRASLLEVLGQDYIRTARAKGLGEGRVVVVHGLRNALPPLLQLLGVSLPALLNGSLVLEVVFSWPGLGQVTFQALQTRDFPVILATTALSAVLVVGGNLAADVLHAAADPRLRHA